MPLSSIVAAELGQEAVVSDQLQRLGDRLHVLGRLRGEVDVAVAPHLEAVVAGDRDRVDRHHPPRLGGRPARHARHERVGLGQPLERAQRLRDDPRLVRRRDDRSQRAVDVAHDRRRARDRL